jgi:alpha-D-ribose 1-methylphosphonate 5-triphosphate synthase subunit PhnH
MNTTATVTDIGPGFADPVHDAQQAFRAALDALSHPGRIVEVGGPLQAGTRPGAAMACLLLALTDDDTAVWWQDDSGAHAQWLRFHTGAKTVGVPCDAAFGAIASPLAMPSLSAFATGTLAAPEFSTTLLIEVPSLDTGPQLQCHGPGIREAQGIRVDGLPPAFWSQWQENHAAFPQGVDAIFTCATRAVGLPRTTRVSRVEGL